MNLKNFKIAIFTRSMNYSLFKMMDNTLTLPFKHYRFTFTTAHGYLYKIMKYDIDYAINIDEDAFVCSNESLLSLLNYCIENEIINCGIRDGGVLPIRFGNPIVTNPFFNIFNVKEIRKHFSLDEIDKYRNIEIDYKKILTLELPFRYETTSNYEPFYPFFLWLNTNFKVLYLSAEEHKDKYSTILLNQENKPFLYHSWYSRKYGVDIFHTNRINNLYLSCGKCKTKLNFVERIKIYFEKSIYLKVFPTLLPIRRFILHTIIKKK